LKAGVLRIQAIFLIKMACKYRGNHLRKATINSI
jgi:hypothetical protein